MVKGVVNVKKASKVKHVLVAVAITLVFVFFISYCIQAFSPEPKYEDYCVDSVKPLPTNQESCEANGWVWKPQERVGSVYGYCDNSDYFTACNKEYRGASEVYWGKVFYVDVIIGILTILISFFLIVEAVSNGFLGGGILLIIYVSMRNWEWLSNFGRTLLLGLALVALVYVGYKKLK